jgi:hypothetical protein
LQHWVDERGPDGFVPFEALPGQLDLFVDKVIPILQARGCFAPKMRARPSPKISAFPSRQSGHRRAVRLFGKREAVASPRHISKRKENYVLEMGRAIMWRPAYRCRRKDEC